MIKRALKYITISTVVLSLFASSAFAATIDKDVSDIEIDDNEVAYYTYTVKELNNTDSDTIKKEEQFKKTIKNTKNHKERLKKIIDKKKEKSETSKIIWDKKFVEKHIKNKNNELYTEIKKQMDEDSKSKAIFSNDGKKKVKTNSPSFKPGKFAFGDIFKPYMYSAINSPSNSSLLNIASNDNEEIGTNGIVVKTTVDGWFSPICELTSECNWTWTKTKVTSYWPLTTPDTCGTKNLAFTGLTKSTATRLGDDTYGDVSIIKQGEFKKTYEELVVNFKVYGDYTFESAKYKKDINNVNVNAFVDSSRIPASKTYSPRISYKVRKNGGYNVISGDLENVN